MDAAEQVGPNYDIQPEEIAIPKHEAICLCMMHMNSNAIGQTLTLESLVVPAPDEKIVVSWAPNPISADKIIETEIEMPVLDPRADGVVYDDESWASNLTIVGTYMAADEIVGYNTPMWFLIRKIVSVNHTQYPVIMLSETDIATFCLEGKTYYIYSLSDIETCSWNDTWVVANARAYDHEIMQYNAVGRRDTLPFLSQKILIRPSQEGKEVAPKILVVPSKEGL